ADLADAAAAFLDEAAMTAGDATDAVLFRMPQSRRRGHRVLIEDVRLRRVGDEGLHTLILAQDENVGWVESARPTDLLEAFRRDERIGGSRRLDPPYGSGSARRLRGLAAKLRHGRVDRLGRDRPGLGPAGPADVEAEDVAVEVDERAAAIRGTEDG